MTEARQTPLPDLLDGVPEKTVLGIRGDEPMFPSYTNIPIGRLAREAAAELRRLQALLEAEQALHQRVTYPELQRLRAQRDALLEALQALYDEQEGPPLIRRHRQWQAAMDKARAAIKAVEEGKA